MDKQVAEILLKLTQVLMRDNFDPNLPVIERDLGAIINPPHTRANDLVEFDLTVDEGIILAAIINNALDAAPSRIRRPCGLMGIEVSTTVEHVSNITGFHYLLVQSCLNNLVKKNLFYTEVAPFIAGVYFLSNNAIELTEECWGLINNKD